MLLLVLDTCDARGSVAIFRDDIPLQVVTHETSDDYSVWLLPAVARVLAAEVSFADVDVYVAAAGPGSFTGVRVGLTTVKAWGEVTGKPIVSVSRLEALAAEAHGAQAYVAAFTNGQRRQVFAALYRRGNAGLELVGEESVIAPDKFLAWALDTAGEEPIQWVSTDADMLRETDGWKARHSVRRVVANDAPEGVEAEAGASVSESVLAASPFLAPAIGRLGYQLAQAKRFSDPLQLDANYVRRSDAEAFWKDHPATHR